MAIFDDSSILTDEMPSWKFLADNHSELTMYDLKDVSFKVWCQRHKLSYIGWCNDTRYWNPTDQIAKPGFMFFDLENEKDIWLHGFGMTKEQILERIYSKTALELRFPNEERDKEYRQSPYPSFQARATEVFFQNLFKNIGFENSPSE